MALPNLGPTPRYLEELRLGGGFASAPDGGADFDKAGNAALDGDLTVGGALDLRGALVNTAGAAVVIGDPLELHGALRTALDGCDKTWSAWLAPQAAIKSVSAPATGPNGTWTGNFSASYTHLDFHQSTRQFAGWMIALPADYDGSALRLVLFWTAAAGTAGQAVVWRARLGAFADNSDPSAATADVGAPITDVLLATGRIHVVAAPVGTPLNAAAGGLLAITVDRQADVAGDTLAADAKLIGLRLEYA